MATHKFKYKKYYSIEYNIDKIFRSTDSKTAVQGIHHHNSDDFFEIIFFIRENSSFLIEGTTYALEPNDIMFTVPDEIHGITHHSSCEYERYILRIKNDFFVVNSLEDLYTKFKEKQLGEGNYIKHDTPVNKNICAIFVKLKESPTAEDGTRYVTEILSLLAHRTQLISQKRIPNPLIRQIILYINSHSAEDISLETIAQKFYISKSHLTRIFKEYTNTTINQYISAERLNVARQNVRYRGMSHKDAAIAAGFKEYSSYYRAYKGKYGVSPGESDSCLNFI